ncbi:M50 family metallopeptidase [Candidatus Woesearchaeota archaeon]|nr:M50 family metallopeptidase [Candidatus Woesearchaeota archaeon]
MLITIREVIDLLIMTLALGYLFKDAFPKHDFSSGEMTESLPTSTTWKDIQFAAIITAPAIILHELAHKFVALSFGAQAVFHAHYPFLGLGILLKLLNFGFIFFIPGYVTHSSVAPLASSAIAAAGPLLNLVLWLGSALLLKKNLVKKKFKAAVYLTKRINMFLFLLNMIPIPPFDGFGFVSGLWSALF